MITTRFPHIHQFHSVKELHGFVSFLPKDYQKIDVYEKLLLEKFLVENPKIYFSSPEIQTREFKKYVEETKRLNANSGTWVYHPWDKKLYRLINHQEYFNLRTVRNRNLLTYEQQTKLNQKKIAIAGLSVGLNVFISLIRYGIGNEFHIADSDTVSATNINRSVYGIEDLGLDKCEVAAREAHKIDPYLKIKLFYKGLNNALLEEFISGTDLIVDAFDNFDLKIKLRKLAKLKKIPVISGFDVEKGILLIVERYDTEPDLMMDFFLNEKQETDFSIEQLTPQKRTELFINLIGKKHHSDVMLDSVLKVGTELTGYPQLVIATYFAAAAFTYTAEAVLLKKNLASTRKFISLAEIIHPYYD